MPCQLAEGATCKTNDPPPPILWLAGWLPVYVTNSPVYRVTNKWSWEIILLINAAAIHTTPPPTDQPNTTHE